MVGTMALEDGLLDRALRARGRVLDAQHALDGARGDYEDLIRRLVAAGGTTREVGSALSISHQRVHQIVDSGPVTAAGDGPRLFARRARTRVERAFSRFDEASHDLLAAARAEAVRGGRDALGTDHVLLVLTGSHRAAGRALRALGLDRRTTRVAVTRLREEAPRSRERARRPCVDPGAMPMTPDLKRVLQTASEVTPPGQPIRPEHLLVALARVPETNSAAVLAGRGIDEEALLNAFVRLDAGET